VTAADFNGDGKPDLAVASLGASSAPFSTVSVLFGDSAGGFGPAANYAVAKSPWRIAAGDFNGDGLLDVITANNNADNVSVLLNTCGASSGGSPTLQLSAQNYAVGEGAGSLTVTVTRTGGVGGTASVRYATSDGTASERSDYIASLGTLSFAPGESAKSFKVLIVDDARAGEGGESFNITLSDASGATFGATSSAAVTIQDNDQTFTGVNPINDPQFFVREHYYDFLNREPDADGLAFWKNQMTNCSNPPPADLTVCKVNVSAAFFLSIEFQNTGYLVERVYKAAYGDAVGNSTLGGTHQLSVPAVRLSEFLRDTQEIQGTPSQVIVGQGDWQRQLEENKGAFALEFVSRQRFTSAFPASLTAGQFVSKLDSNAGGALSPSEREQVVALFGGATASSDDTAKRAAALRAVAESPALISGEKNRAFVLLQYFGYLRRNPNDPQDTDYTGYDFWLRKLDQFNGDAIAAEMVKAFITSDEYRKRFGQ